MAEAEPDHPQSTLTRYRALLEINELISEHRHFEDFFRDLSRLLSRIIPFEGIGISIYDTDRQTVKLYLLEASNPNDIPVGQNFPMTETPALDILNIGRPVYIPDLDRESRFASVRSMLRGHGIRSYCVLPLATARGCIGGLNFGSCKPDAYSADDIEFMRTVAHQAAIILEDILSHETTAVSQRELARERDHLRLLLNVSTAIADKLETRELFAAISLCLREALKVEYASLTLFDAENNCLRRHSLDFPGGGGILQEDAAIPIENTTVGEAFTKGVPVSARRADIERMPPDIAAGMLGEGLNFLCAVPLVSRKRVLGTLNVASLREDAFNHTGVRLLEEVAAQFAVALDNALAYKHIEELNKKLAQEKLYLADEIRSNYFFEEIIGSSQPLQNVLRQVEVVAPSDSTVLICGETGTGKELVARAIHNLSGRKQATFVKLNCAAMPTGLMESEMFGHEKGAFTGAVSQRTGRFELANRGTLFLDEIGEIPLDLQPKLLRVLQEQEFERLGSGRTIHVDVRLVAATNKDLQSMVKNGTFRADLFYRLNVFPIVMPPLRERRADIPKLVRYFVQQVARRMGKRIETINSETMEELARYSWPGNIRELQNIIERAVILSSGTVLKVPEGELQSSREIAGGMPQTMEEAERHHILQALEEANWVVGGPQGAAARLGLKRSTLQSRMQKLGISRPH
jgi:formate hydrogenlyase transcriptional activator